METVAQPPADAELDLLTHWGDADTRPRAERAAVLSLLTHVVVIAAVLWLPWGGSSPAPQPEVVRHITPLVAPLTTQLTQKAPNTGKVNKEFAAAEVQPRPRLQAPAGPPPAPRRAAIPALPKPAPQAPKLPEAPTVAAVKAPPPAEIPQLPVAPPPQIQATEKSPFENPAAPTAPVPPGQSKVPIPDTSVSDAVRQSMRNKAGGPGINMPPSPASQASTPQLLSDPMGVDFKPYLTQILNIVRRNWFAVYPESARLGMRGEVGIIFSIEKNGKIDKVVLAGAQQTTLNPLQRAAVVAISMSNPLPPLPPEYKGNQIALQFNFAYNMPK